MISLSFPVPPKIEHFSFPPDIQQGSRVLVTCVVSSGDLPLRIEWLFEGSPVLPDGVTTYTHGEDDLSLRIASAAPRHSGNYTCVARNQAAQVSHEAALIVHGTAAWTNINFVSLRTFFIYIIHLYLILCSGKILLSRFKRISPHTSIIIARQCFSFCLALA